MLIRSLCLSLLLGCLVSWSAAAQVTLHPSDDQEGQTVQSGRGWILKGPGAGNGSLKQVDVKQEVIVGDSQNEHGWAYIMGFVVTEEFAKQSLVEDATLKLTVHTGKAHAGGAPSPVRLHLLHAQKEQKKFSVYGAYNHADHLATIDGQVEPDAEDQEVTFDVTEAVAKAGGVKPGTVLYLALYCEPLNDADEKGEFLFFHASGEKQPALTVKTPPNVS